MEVRHLALLRVIARFAKLLLAVFKEVPVKLLQEPIHRTIAGAIW